ncbi:CbrC family protein [Armatimonas sp.]|uniref:CbrC family protein n=1 Tax=Armatimonas sp. TaxID=1872638 RepID=UPI00374D45B2
MPPFRYFLAPEDCMSGLSRYPETCVFCGKRTRAFSFNRSFGCPECLQAGYFGFNHDTELGMIIEDKVLLMGIDSDDEEDFLVPIRDAAEKIGMPEAQLRELQRTPCFLTCNNVTWMVCCQDFMAYLGQWQPENFASREAFVEAMSRQSDFSTIRWLWPEDETNPHFGEMVIHVFRCLHCSRLRAVNDST